MDGPFDPELSLNAEDIQSLQDWGMNFVRLGVMWEAVERTRGVVDTDYFDKVEKLINALGEKGIYTLVDMHQDVFARTICGEGFPDFYAKEALGDDPHCINGWIDPLLQKIYDLTGVCVSIDDYGFRKDENDDPLIEDCQTVDFYKFYMTKESINAFDALYTNKGGLRDKFVDYWDITSARFAANQYVVGFDPLNEPFPGNFINKPSILAPGHMDRNELNPMYELI
jgi:endoglycosylceramidase